IGLQPFGSSLSTANVDHCRAGCQSRKIGWTGGNQLPQALFSAHPKALGRMARDGEVVEETMRRTVAFLLGGGLATLLAGSALGQEIDWKKVDAALGRTGAAMPGGVHRYGVPRSDLSVTVDGVTIKPALALGGWVAFEPAHDGAMVMGDLVLTESEIKPVMTKLLEGGIEITALHNHLLRANPATFYMHVGGHGDPVKMAQTIKAALALSKAPAETGQAAAPPPAPDLPTAQLDEILGVKGKAVGGVYQFSVPRRD